VAPPYVARDPPVRGKSLPFAVKLWVDFTGSCVSARSQRVRQGREFARDTDPLDWHGPGLSGPPWEI
jgi:hypothetical protein